MNRSRGGRDGAGLDGTGDGRRADVAANLLRYLGGGVTLVSGPAGQPVLLAFTERRLFAILVFTIRDDLIGKIEATVDPRVSRR